LRARAGEPASASAHQALKLVLYPRARDLSLGSLFADDDLHANIDRAPGVDPHVPRREHVQPAEPDELGAVRAHRGERGAVLARARDGEERARRRGHAGRSEAGAEGVEVAEEPGGKRRERAGVLCEERDGGEGEEFGPASGGVEGVQVMRRAEREGGVVRVPGDSLGVEGQDLWDIGQR
jgi:hypothetical protein